MTSIECSIKFRMSCYSSFNAWNGLEALYILAVKLGGSAATAFQKLLVSRFKYLYIVFLVLFQLDIEVHFCIKLYVIKATNGTVKGCVGFQIRFLNLYDYQLDLFCVQLWSNEKSETCQNPFESKKFCPPHEVSPKIKSVVSHAAGPKKELSWLEGSDKTYDLPSMMDSPCSHACPKMANAQLSYLPVKWGL